MQIFTLYVLEFFQVASAIELHKKPICAFRPIAISPHSPLLYLYLNIVCEREGGGYFFFSSLAEDPFLVLLSTCDLSYKMKYCFPFCVVRSSSQLLECY
jgi:hypothetical protein